MKKIIALYLLLISSVLSLECMEQKEDFSSYEWLEKVPFDENAYPAYKGRMRLEGIIDELMIPEDKKEDIDTLFNNKELASASYYELSSNNMNDDYSLQACAQKDINRKKYIGRFNITPTQKHLIGIPNISNAVRSNLSSMGFDPYTSSEKNNPATIKKALDYQPTIHNLTTVIAQRLLKKFSLKGEPVKALESWIYPLHTEKKPFDDRYYVPVHECPSEAYKFLHQLTPEEKSDFFAHFDLIGFKQAIQYISFAFPDKHHLLVHPKDYTVIILEPISPNNEGIGPDRKYGNAVLGRNTKDLEKAFFNDDNPYDGARRTFEGVLSEFSPEKVTEWNELYKTKESSIK